MIIKIPVWLKIPVQPKASKTTSGKKLRIVFLVEVFKNVFLANSLQGPAGPGFLLSLDAACILLIACLVDGRSYTLLALRNICRTLLEAFRGIHCPLCCCNEILYLPFSSLNPTIN